MGYDNYSYNKKKKNNGKRIAVTIIADLLLICAGLYVYCLFQFILPRDVVEKSFVLPTPSENQSAPASTATGTGTGTDGGTATHAPEDQGDWGAKFPDKFTSGEVVKTDNSYKSRDINVTLQKVQENDVTYFVADIYIRNLENFKTAFANNKFGIGQRDTTVNMAKNNKAIIAISGDYCGTRQEGIVIRNGVLYRSSKFQDILLMNNDGSMQTYTAEQFDINNVLKNGAYQGWSFGPMLLDNGKPMEKFNTDVNPKNPRSAIGYYEPGHYVFVLVDGRQQGYSVGLTIKEMSQLFYKLGCKVAYNLDGGQTAVMAFMGELADQPYLGGREVSDIVYIGEK